MDRTGISLQEKDADAGQSYNLDRVVHAALAHVNKGISPHALTAANLDWLTHLAGSPGKQHALIEKAMRKASRLVLYALRNKANRRDPCIEPLPQDRRFRHPEWQKDPFNLVYQAFLLTQQWWDNATTGVRGSRATTSR